MLHQLLNQIAPAGGAASVGLLLVASVISVAIISKHAWFLRRNRVNGDLLARQLLPLLATGDWTRARAVATRSSASVCLVISAGLTQVDQGKQAVRAAMLSVKAHQRIRLEGELGVLAAIGRSALLIGLLGTCFNLTLLARDPATTLAGIGPTFSEVLDVIGPMAAGLIVAIPALLASSILKCRARHILSQVDCLAHLLLLQIGNHKRRLARPQVAVRSAAA